MLDQGCPNSRMNSLWGTNYWLPGSWFGHCSPIVLVAAAVKVSELPFLPSASTFCLPLGLLGPGGGASAAWHSSGVPAEQCNRLQAVWHGSQWGMCMAHSMACGLGVGSGIWPSGTQKLDSPVLDYWKIFIP